MKATIYGEDEVVTGVEITDNNGHEHDIQVERDGSIYSHHQDGYHDKAAKRTHEDNERVEQARRFGKYYVFQERGYDTLPPLENPVRIEAARRALADLSPSAFTSMFGDYYQQFKSDFDSSVEPVVELPADVADPDLVVYQRDLYLEIDPETVDFGEKLQTLTDDYGVELTAPVTDSSPETWREFGQAAADAAADAETSLLSEMDIAAVSGIHLMYPDTADTKQRVTAETPLEEDPDARIELPSVNPGSLEQFQAFLSFHLRCQVRDLFIGMGVEPPEAFRVLGPGRYASTMRYRLLDMYDEYYHLDDPNLEEWAEA